MVFDTVSQSLPLRDDTLVSLLPEARPFHFGLRIDRSRHAVGETWQSIEASGIVCLAVLTELVWPSGFRPATERISLAFITVLWHRKPARIADEARDHDPM